MGGRRHRIHLPDDHDRAAMVFFMKRQSSALMQQIFLGFASGVMIAASIWSLLIPAIDEAAQNGQPGWMPAAGGFILGLVLMLTLDGLMPHLHSGAEQAEGLPSSFRRTTLLVLAVTLHNIPEGMAVGLSFARAAQHTGNAGLFAAAGALAIGIGHSEFPGRSRSRASAPSGGTQPHALVRLRFAVRHCRTYLRRTCCAVRVRADTIHAVAAVRRRRRDAVRRGRGVDSRGTSR